MNDFSVIAHSRSSAITSLALSDPDCPHQCDRILLQWPSKLVRLSLSHLIGSTYECYYTLDAVELLLSIHRESLQDIAVSLTLKPQERYGGALIASGIPDFSKFPCLRKLQLSSLNLLAERPSQAAAKLAAPVLRHLAIITCTEDQHPECRAFAEHQVLWMAGIACLYSTREPETRLYNIFVDFNLEDKIWDNDDDTPRPWECLDEIEREIYHDNLFMRYNELTSTREEWDQIGRSSQTEIEAGVIRSRLSTISKCWISVALEATSESL